MKDNRIFPIPYRMLGAVRCACIVLISLVVASCLNTKQAPSSALQEAILAIDYAEQSRATFFAAAELNDAKTKLKNAQVAVSNKKMVQAEMLAIESKAAAELATYRSKLGMERFENSTSNRNKNQSTIVDAGEEK